jgi:hypothetical protein
MEDRLIDAVRRGDRNSCRALVAAGADVNAECIDKTYAYNVPLLEAVTIRDMEICKLLIEAGADVNAASMASLGGDGDSALHVAIARAATEIAEYLIERGASVSAANEKGATPLHVAVLYDDVQMFRRLVRAGADMYSLNEAGHSPLHIILRKKMQLVDEYLEGISFDASYTPVDPLPKYHSPLHEAIRAGHLEVVSRILSDPLQTIPWKLRDGRKLADFAGKRGPEMQALVLAFQTAQEVAAALSVEQADHPGPRSPSTGMSPL